jgi:hypothetical protein
VINIIRLKNIILISILIALSGSILHVGYFTLTYATGVILSFFWLIKDNKVNKNKLIQSLICGFVFITIYVLNFLFTKSNDFYDYKIIILQTLLSLFILILIDEEQFLGGLSRLLFLIIVFSLFGFVLSFLDLGREYSFPSGFHGKTYFNIFYYHSTTEILGLKIYRNQGIFWEPGILSIYSNVYIFLKLFYKKDSRGLILGVLAILTTFSTTGLLMMGLQFLVFIFTNNTKLLYKIIAVLFGIFFLIFSLFSLLEKKSEQEVTALNSFSLRSFDLLVGTQILIDNPLIGIGLNKSVFLHERDNRLPSEMLEIIDYLEDRGNTNSLIALLYSFGLLVSLVFLFFLYKNSYFYKKRFLFFVLMLFSLSSEPLLSMPFFLLLILSGFRNCIININYSNKNKKLIYE